ncbi:MAG: hypothetical protein FK731_09710 [Asgard group archaeon]|nr:hypothetical protein [Asgard group archaeon]
MSIKENWDSTEIKINFDDGNVDIVKNYDINFEGYSRSPYQNKTRSEYDVTYIGFNLKSTLTPEINEQTLTEDETMSKGLAVRKAIAHMINKEQITELIEIESSIIESPLSNKFGIYIKPDITSYIYNLDLAKQYMLKAGYDPATIVTPNISFFEVFGIIFLVSTATLILRKNKK